MLDYRYYSVSSCFGRQEAKEAARYKNVSMFKRADNHPHTDFHPYMWG